ncbi:MAG TPA: dephospho-CoA kinase [Blastocatellia bacterium]|nr:dephospho-CoA kinase [Blastocatellia bacterium]
MLKVGLTGSIAVGKSFVLSVLAELGCVTFDADKIAHSVMEPGRPAHQDIVREFGPDVLAEDGSIDRVKLGAIVFADEGRRNRLNEIVHPRVIEEQNRLLSEAEAANPEGIAIIDAALMIESGGYKRFDKLIVAYCDRESQIGRLMRRNRITRDDAERRIAAQMSSDEKRRYADFEIDTSGPLEETRDRIGEVYDSLVNEVEARQAMAGNPLREDGP